MKTVQLHRFPDPQSLAKATAAAWIEGMEKSSTPTVPQHVAFSGGRIAKPFFEFASRLLHEHKPAWDDIHYYWADERCVPPEDSDSNYALACASFFATTQTGPDHIHRILGEESPESAAQHAAETLERLAPKNELGHPVLDYVFLGVGEDGHVASLFPGGLAPDMSHASYRAVIGPKPPPNRVTLTYPVLLAAKQVWVLASGEGKSDALKRSLNQGEETPLGWVLDHRQETHVFTDVNGV